MATGYEASRRRRRCSRLAHTLLGAPPLKISAEPTTTMRSPPPAWRRRAARRRRRQTPPSTPSGRRSRGLEASSSSSARTTHLHSAATCERTRGWYYYMRLSMETTTTTTRRDDDDDDDPRGTVNVVASEKTNYESSTVAALTRKRAEQTTYRVSGPSHRVPANMCGQYSYSTHIVTVLWPSTCSDVIDASRTRRLHALDCRS